MQSFISLRMCVLLAVVSYAPSKSAEAPTFSGYLDLGNPDPERPRSIFLDLSLTPLNSRKTWNEIITKIHGSKELVIQVATKKEGQGFGLSFFLGETPLDQNHDSIVMIKKFTKDQIRNLLSSQSVAQPFYPTAQGYPPDYRQSPYLHPYTQSGDHPQFCSPAEAYAPAYPQSPYSDPYTHAAHPCSDSYTQEYTSGHPQFCSAAQAAPQPYAAHPCSDSYTQEYAPAAYPKPHYDPRRKRYVHKQLLYPAAQATPQSNAAHPYPDHNSQLYPPVYQHPVHPLPVSASPLTVRTEIEDTMDSTIKDLVRKIASSSKEEISRLQAALEALIAIRNSSRTPLSTTLLPTPAPVVLPPARPSAHNASKQVEQTSSDAKALEKLLSGLQHSTSPQEPKPDTSTKDANREKEQRDKEATEAERLRQEQAREEAKKKEERQKQAAEEATRKTAEAERLKQEEARAAAAAAEKARKEAEEAKAAADKAATEQAERLKQEEARAAAAAAEKARKEAEEAKTAAEQTRKKQEEAKRAAEAERLKQEQEQARKDRETKEEQRKKEEEERKQKEKEAARGKARKEAKKKEEERQKQAAEEAERLKQEQEQARKDREAKEEQRKKEEEERKQKEKDAAREKARKDREAKEQAQLDKLEKQVEEAEAKIAAKRAARIAAKTQQHTESVTPKVNPADSFPIAKPVAPADGSSTVSKAEQARIRQMRIAAEKKAASETAAAAETDRFKEIEKAYQSQNYLHASELLGECDQSSQRFADTVVLLARTIMESPTEGTFIALYDLALPLVAAKEKRLINLHKIELLLFLAGRNEPKMRLQHLEQAKELGDLKAPLRFYTQLIKNDCMNPDRPQCQKGISCIHREAADCLSSTHSVSSLPNCLESFVLSACTVVTECPNILLSARGRSLDDIYEQAKENLSEEEYQSLLQIKLPTRNNPLSTSAPSAFIPGSKTRTDSDGASVTVPSVAAAIPEPSAACLEEFNKFFKQAKKIYGKPDCAEEIRKMISTFFEQANPKNVEVFFICNTLLNNHHLLTLFYEVLLTKKILSPEELKELSSSVLQHFKKLKEQLDPKNPDHQSAIAVLFQFCEVARIIATTPGREYTVIKNKFFSLLQSFFQKHTTVKQHPEKLHTTGLARKLACRLSQKKEENLLNDIFALLPKVITKKDAVDFLSALKPFENDENYIKLREQIDKYVESLRGDNLAVWYPYTILPSSALIELLSSDNAKNKRDFFVVTFSQFKSLLSEYLSKVTLTPETFVHLEDLFAKLFKYTSSRTQVEEVFAAFHSEKFACCILKMMYLHVKYKLVNECDKIKAVNDVIEQLKAHLRASQEKTAAYYYIEETLGYMEAELAQTGLSRHSLPPQGAASADMEEQKAT